MDQCTAGLERIQIHTNNETDKQNAHHKLTTNGNYHPDMKDTQAKGISPKPKQEVSHPSGTRV